MAQEPKYYTTAEKAKLTLLVARAAAGGDRSKIGRKIDQIQAEAVAREEAEESARDAKAKEERDAKAKAKAERDSKSYWF
ncbi:hypothetical protein ACFY2K_42630 [Kitasatospora sp. NPDC001309]|uniref:hypothetical protein n=1 Tax=Kitasatospora sp. NPDC001309 TaxID=3364013 RepID=UPI0036A5DC51